MIITPAYFFGKLRLPQTGNPEGLADVQKFIDVYEPEFLQKALGYDLWQAFTEGIADSDSGSGAVIDQRWIDLLEGKAFTLHSREWKWIGFEGGPLHLSPIANYVYYKYRENGVSDTVLVGEVQSTTDNNRVISPRAKMQDAWNEMCEMLQGLRGFLYANQAIYPEWKTHHDCSNHFQKVNSFDI